MRTFNFTRKTFVEFSEFDQGLFQELWRLYLLTRVECQIRVHTEVYPYAFTCSGQHFFRRVICHDIKPVCSNCITQDLDIANFAFPIAVVMERKPTFVKFQGLRGGIPRFERETHTSFFKNITTLKLRRTIFVTLLELWAAYMGKVKEPSQARCRRIITASSVSRGIHAQCFLVRLSNFVKCGCRR